MDASTRFDTQVVGALPLIEVYFELLSLGATIDEVVPWEGDVALGTLAEILIANRLLNPKALFRVGEWAQKAGLTDYYGLTAEQLNDDRLGRALERLAAHAHTVQAALVLKTNLAAKTHPTAKALATDKEQTHVERRFGNVKGPLAVAPMFLEKPARMAGLLCILVWALMVMALMERAVRRNLKGKPLYGLYPENRPSAAPTSTALLQCFSTVCIVIVKHHGTVTRRLAQFTPIQHQLIQLLAIPPTALPTFKRRCGM